MNSGKKNLRWKHMMFSLIALALQIPLDSFGQVTPVNYKVAFIGDAGTEANADAVLNLILREGANAVVHAGDMTYTDNPTAFEANVNGILGANFPYFWSAGNHDAPTWGGANGFQALGEARMNRLGIPWTGRLGVSSTFTYNGIFFVAAAPSELGVTPAQAGDHIRTSLAGNNAVWSVAYWHKNQTLMQLGDKGNEAGWPVYEEARKGGALIATGHEHSYSRSHEMANMQNQTISATTNTINLKKDDPSTTTTDEGRTFAFVSGLGGIGIRAATGGKENNPWWGKTYHSGNGAQYAALFGEFNYNGDPTLAHFYYKNINNVVVDEFFVRSEVEAPQVCSTPAAPANVTSSSVQQTSATISWNSVPLVASYNVRHKPIGSTTWAASNVTSTSLSLTGLIANTQYEVQVNAVCASGTISPFSSSHNFTTLPIPDTEAPTIPSGLTASNVTMNSVNLSWTASTDNVGVTGYDVYQGTAKIGTSAVTSFNVTGLAANTAYSFTVRAKDAAGNISGNSNALNVTTLADTQAPSAPTGLTGTPSVTTVDLSWTASTDNVGVTGYDIYQGTANVGTSATTSFRVTGLTANTAYGFTVRAKDAAGNLSGNSNVLNVTTLSAPDTEAPSVPSGLTASNVTMNSLSLSWTASTDNVGVTGYDVYQGAAKIGTSAITSFNVTGLAVNTAYSFTLRAKDAAGNISGNSNAINVTTLADTQAPTIPTGLTGTATATTVDLSWTASTDNVGVTGYNIYQGTANVGTSATTSFRVTGLTANTAYSFTVRAKDTAGNISGNSNALAITTLVSNPEVLLVANNSGGDKIEVNQGQNGAQSFRYGTSGTYTVTKVVLYVSKDKEAPTQNLAFNIGTSVNGNPLAGSSVNITPGSITNISEGVTFQTIEVKFSAAITLTAGQTYYLNFSNNSGNGKKYYFEFTSSNTYTNGTYYKSGSDQGKDIRFQVYGSSGANASQISTSQMSASSVEVDDDIVESLRTSFTLYPNPQSGGELNVAFTTSSCSQALIQVIDFAGAVSISENVLTSVGQNHHTINVSTLTPGLYSVGITVNGSTRRSKLLVQR
jgi:chitodextrinase/predicted phosphodiesterase